MNRIEYNSKANYTFNPSHKGAPYMVNGNYCNFGNLCECVASEYFDGVFGYDTKAVPFDKGSDIESVSASVKSSGASLACLYGTDKGAIIGEYFERVHSSMWVYVVELDGVWYLYTMNKAEFSDFLNEWAGLAKESDGERFKVRFKKTSGKMIAWLDERVGA